MKITDNIIIIPWIFGFINAFNPFTNIFIFWLITLIFYGLIAAHIIECIVFRKKIINSPSGALMAFILTLIYGVLYLKTFSKDS